jgi:hypothetical protein
MAAEQPTDHGVGTWCRDHFSLDRTAGARLPDARDDTPMGRGDFGSGFWDRTPTLPGSWCLHLPRCRCSGPELTLPVQPGGRTLVSKPNGFLAVPASKLANGEPIERRPTLRPSLSTSGGRHHEPERYRCSARSASHPYTGGTRTLARGAGAAGLEAIGGLRHVMPLMRPSRCASGGRDPCTRRC